MADEEIDSIERALFQSVEAGFAVRNPDGSFSITDKGREHAKKLRQKFGDDDGVR